MKKASPVSNDSQRRIRRNIERLADPNENVQVTAQRRLIRFGLKAADFLKEAARDEDPVVRFRAVWALGKIGETDSVEVILNATGDPDERVRYDAVMALGGFVEDRRVPPFLLTLIQNATHDPILASAAVSALRKFGDRATSFLAALQKRPDSAISQLIEEIEAENETS